MAVVAGAARGPAVAQEAPRPLAGRSGVTAPDGRDVEFSWAPRDSAVAARLARVARTFVPAPVRGSALPSDTFHVVVAPDEAAFRRWTGGRAPDWGLAVALPAERRIVVRSPRLTGVGPGIVLAHELGHLYLVEATQPNADALPRWFHEGFAALYAGEWRWVGPVRLAWGRLTGELRPLAELEREFPSVPAPDLAYTESLAAVRDLRGRGGDAGIAALLGRVRGGASFDGALRSTYGLTQRQFYDRWEAHMGHEYGWLVAFTDQRAIWVLVALAVAFLFVWRRRQVTREIARRRRAEDRALGEPDDHSLGVEHWERTWEHDDESWRGDDD